ncbi:MAG: hypothetical protein AAF411_02920 [Myxococcota bacterium]
MSTGVASAQDPRSCIEELTEIELDLRLRQLEGHFERNKRRARAHWYAFTLFFGAAAITSAVFAATADEQVDVFANTVSASGAALTFLQSLVIPELAALAPQRFARHPDGTLAQRRAKLRYGLDLLETSAQRAQNMTNVVAYMTPLVWSATWGTIIQRRYDAPLRVLQMTAGGIAVSEARVLLTPMGSVRSWRSMRGSFCGGRYLRRYEPAEIDALERGEPIAARRTHFSFTPMGMSFLHQF